METAVRPDVRLSTVTRWCNFRALSFFYPGTLVLTPDVQGCYMCAPRPMHSSAQ